MRERVLKKAEDGRVREGSRGSDPSYGHNGHFRIHGPCGETLLIVVSDGEDELSESWEHVSVSTARRCPNWIEMCFVKRLFWDDDETVVQFHPRQSEYMNNHPYCLHLWKRRGGEFVLPPTILVGVR